MRTADLVPDGRAAAPLELNDQEFRFTALRPDLGNIRIDGLVESCDWTDGSDDATADVNDFITLTGTIQLRKPHPDQRSATVHLDDGHVIRCEVRWAGEWREVWRMRIWKPSLDLGGAWSFDLSDDSRQIAESRDTFAYRRGKKRKRKGWLYHEIVRDVCRRYRIPLGRVVKGRHRIKRLSLRDASPLDAIRAAVAEERKATGRRYVISWRDGKIDILPLRRSGALYTLKDQIVGGLLESERRADLCTALTGRATVGKGKKRQKIATRVVDRKAVRRYGFIHKQATFRGVDSEHELEQLTKRSLAKRLTRRRSCRLSHPGIAFLRRGHAVRISIPEEGYAGTRGLAYCQAISHRVSAGEYNMDITMSFDDPQDPAEIQKELDAAARRRKRAARKARA